MALSSGCIAYVIDNGKAYVSGRHAMHCNPETGQILGLEGVNLVSIALGKTHAAAITRHGQLFTWGLNNLCQCGRAEVICSIFFPYIVVMSLFDCLRSFHFPSFKIFYFCYYYN